MKETFYILIGSMFWSKSKEELVLSTEEATPYSGRWSVLQAAQAWKAPAHWSARDRALPVQVFRKWREEGTEVLDLQGNVVLK